MSAPLQLLDSSHPLTRGMVFGVRCDLGRTEGHETHGQQSGRVSTARAGFCVPERRGWAFTGASGDNPLYRISLSGTITEATIGLWFMPGSNTSFETAIAQDISTSSIGIARNGTTTTWRMCFRNTTANGPTVAAGETALIVGRWNSSTGNIDCFKNGAYVLSYTGGTGSIALGTFGLGCRASTTSPMSAGSILRGAWLWDRQLTDAEIALHYADPFGYLRPERRSRTVFVDSAASSPGDATGTGVTVNCSLGTASATGQALASGTGINVNCTLGNAESAGAASTSPSGPSVAVVIGSATPTGEALAVGVGVAVSAVLGTATTTGAADTAPSGVNVSVSVGEGAASGGSEGNAIGSGANVSIVVGTAAVSGAALAQGTGVTVSLSMGVADATGAASASGASASVSVTVGTAEASTGASAEGTGVVVVAVLGTATSTGEALASGIGPDAAVSIGTAQAVGSALASSSGVGVSVVVGTATVTGGQTGTATGIGLSVQVGIGTAIVSVFISGALPPHRIVLNRRRVLSTSGRIRVRNISRFDPV